MNHALPRRSLSRLAGICAALLLLTACGPRPLEEVLYREAG